MGRRKNIKICRKLVLHAFETKLPKDIAILILSFRAPMVLVPMIPIPEPIVEYNPRGAIRMKRDWRHPIVRARRAYSYP